MKFLESAELKMVFSQVMQFAKYSNSWLDFEYDIVEHGRYEYHTRQLISEIAKKKTTTDMEDFGRFHGLLKSASQPFPPLIFDRHLQTPVDPAHCLCQGLDAILIDATISLMTPAGKEKFGALIRSLELPSGWSRFQNPVYHIKSYFFSDIARLIMVGPFVLAQLSYTDFNSQQLQSMRDDLNIRTILDAFNEIIKCWVLLASTNAKLFASEVQSYDDLKSTTIELIKKLAQVFPVNSRDLTFTPSYILFFNHTHFSKLEGKLYLNEWIFSFM